VDVPWPARALVEMQKTMTRLHTRFIQSPLGSLPAPPGARFLVLHTVGRHSGGKRQTPLSFTKDGDSYVVIASNGGAPRHPDWYLNLQANPEVDIEVRGKTKHVRAETVTGAARDRLWNAAVASFGGYAGYQMRAQREIPVVRLQPI
jgi:deazaflavin-dependent oxidoreductase (nitroreductase family)